ncbi:hypothetical protein Tco_0448462 [Tanacetum coccineum]
MYPRRDDLYATDNELIALEAKQLEADDQAIQTILMGLLEDIYATVDSCNSAMDIWLRVQQMMKGTDIGVQKKEAKLHNELERFTSTEGKSIESYYYRFNGNGNVVATRAWGNGNGNNANQIRCYNCRGVGHYVKNYTVRPRRRDIEEVNANCILMANLQQASTSGTHVDKAHVYDLNGLAKEQYTKLLESATEPSLVQYDDNNVIPANSSMDPSRGIITDPPVVYDSEETLKLAQESRLKMKQLDKEIKPENYEKINQLLKEEIASIVNQVDVRVIHFEKEFLKEAAKFVRDFKSLANEADESLDKIKVLEKENELLLRAVVSQDIMSIV